MSNGAHFISLPCPCAGKCCTIGLNRHIRHSSLCQGPLWRTLSQSKWIWMLGKILYVRGDVRYGRLGLWGPISMPLMFDPLAGKSEREIHPPPPPPTLNMVHLGWTSKHRAQNQCQQGTLINRVKHYSNTSECKHPPVHTHHMIMTE